MSLSDETDEYNDPAEGQPLSTEVALRSEVDDLRQQLERAKATPKPRLPISRNPIDEWVLVVRDYNLLAQSLARTAFVPEAFQGKPDQVTAAMMYGREVGLGPMTTLQNTVVIHGKVSMYAEQLRAMVLAAGHEFDVVELNSDRCVISGRRKGTDRWQTFTYAMDQAKLSGLYAQNDQYRKRPTEMMLARASSLMAHAMFSDVIRGMGVIEELEGDPDGVPDNAPAPAAKATAQVGRKKAARVPAAAITAGATTAEPVIPEETLPPLPGEVASEQARPVASRPLEGEAPVESPGAAGSPGEGHGEPATPAAPTERLMEGPPPQVHEGPAPAGPPAERHCPDYDNSHPAHVWRTDDEGHWITYQCPGVAAVQSAPVQDLPRRMTKADTIMLQTRFKNMGFTDSEEDIEARLRTASVILGRPENNLVETFRVVDPGEGGMTKDEAVKVLKVLAPCKDRGAVVDLLAKITQDRGQNQ